MSTTETVSQALAAQVAEAIERVLSGEIDGCIFVPSSKDPEGITIEIASSRLESSDTPKTWRPEWRKQL